MPTLTHHAPRPVTSEEFRAFFEKFGTLMDCIVMFDRETSRSRGFGFVSFEDPGIARMLLSMGSSSSSSDPVMNLVEPMTGRMEMRGKMIEIKAAEPKESAPNRRQQPARNVGRTHKPSPVYPFQATANNSYSLSSPYAQQATSTYSPYYNQAGYPGYGSTYYQQQQHTMMYNTQQQQLSHEASSYPVPVYYSYPSSVSATMHPAAPGIVVEEKAEQETGGDMATAAH